MVEWSFWLRLAATFRPSLLGATIHFGYPPPLAGLRLAFEDEWVELERLLAQQRQNEMWTEGDRVLRFPAWAIRNDPERVIAQIDSALRAAGWRR